MSTEELVEFLKENLSLKVDYEYEFYGDGRSYKIDLVLGTESISTEYIDVPGKCRCNKGDWC